MFIITKAFDPRRSCKIRRRNDVLGMLPSQTAIIRLVWAPGPSSTTNGPNDAGTSRWRSWAAPA